MSLRKSLAAWMKPTIVALAMATIATPSLTFADDIFTFAFSATVDGPGPLGPHGFPAGLTTVTGTFELDVPPGGGFVPVSDSLTMNIGDQQYSFSGHAAVIDQDQTSEMVIQGFLTDAPFRASLILYPVPNVSPFSDTDCPMSAGCIFPDPPLYGGHGVLELRSSGGFGNDPIAAYSGQTYYLNANITSVVATPEPSTWLLLASGLVGIIAAKARRTLRAIRTHR